MKSEWNDSSDEDEDEERKEEPYIREDVIGKGTFGTVYKSRVRFPTTTAAQQQNQFFAIKRIKTSKPKDGVEFTALREIRALRDLEHPNILSLVDVYVFHRVVHLVFELMDSDLEKVIRDEHIALPESHVKAYSKMMLEGIRYLHGSYLLHRDIKPGNMLLKYDPITHETQLKISDFGLCRPFASPGRCLTPSTVTRWYRPPELLFAADKYGFFVDMWSCGCVIAEMLLRVPLLAGNSDLDQLNKISQALGAPSEKNWPGVSTLPGFIAFNDTNPCPLQQIFPAVSNDAVSLLERLLSLCPTKRGTASDALSHPFFTNANGIVPTPSNELPKPPMKSSSSSDSRTNRSIQFNI